MRIPTTAIFLLVAIAGRAQEFAKEDIKADIEFLKDTLPNKHPNLFFKILQEEFNASLDSISSRADTLSNFEIIMSLRKAIAAVGDPHTNFGFYEAISAQGYFPIEIFWFSDGVYAMGSDERYQQVLGKKLVAIRRSY